MAEGESGFEFVERKLRMRSGRCCRAENDPIDASIRRVQNELD